MNTPEPEPAETQKLLSGLAAGGFVPDSVAGWLAGHYASSAHEELAGSDESSFTQASNA
jgi:hypothetical protein